MEDLIKKLLEVDSAAREKVSSAEKERAGLASDLEQKKKSMHDELEKNFARELEKKKKQAQEIIENDYSPEKTAQSNKAITDRLDALYEENKDEWVRMLVERVIS